MLNYILSYTKTKRFTDIVTRDINQTDLDALIEVENSFGPNAFTRGKSKLSDRIIAETIPTMVQYNIDSVANNLIKLKTVKRNSFEHYQLLYGTKATEIYKTRTNKSAQSRENFIKRHGLVEGNKLFNALIEKKRKQNTLEGYIEKYGLDGHKKHKEYIEKCRKSHRLDGYIEKYGIEEGRKIFDKLYDVPRLCLERMILKYGDEGALKYAEIRQKISNKFKGSTASKESLQIFLPVFEAISYHNFTIFFGYVDSREYYLWNLDTKEFYFYDFYIKELGIIFEFNGEHVHPRKELLTKEEFSTWTCAWTGRSAEEAYEYDMRKKKTAEANNIEVIYLWRGDGVEFNINKTLTIIKRKIDGLQN